MVTKRRRQRQKQSRKKGGSSPTDSDGTDFEFDFSPTETSPVDVNMPLKHIEPPLNVLPKRVLHINPSVFDIQTVKEIRRNAKLGDPDSKKLLKDYYNRLAIGKYDYHKIYNTPNYQKMIERKAKRSSNKTLSKRENNKVDSIFVKAMNDAFTKK